MLQSLTDKKAQAEQDKVLQKDHNLLVVELFLLQSQETSQRKSTRTALLSAISAKLAQKELTVLDKFEIASAKTKDAAAFLNAFKFDGSVLVVSTANTEKELRATSNIEKLDIVNVELLNVYEVVSNRNVVLTKEAVKYLEEVNA